MFWRKKDKLISALKKRNRELFFQKTDLEKEIIELKKDLEKDKEVTNIRIETQENKIKDLEKQIKEFSSKPTIKETSKYIEQKPIYSENIDEDERSVEKSISKLKEMTLFNKKKKAEKASNKLTETDLRTILLLSNGPITYKELAKLTNKDEQRIRNWVSRLGVKIDIQERTLDDNTKEIWIDRNEALKLPAEVHVELQKINKDSM